ncbi:MAG: DUF167 domain-containing protein [Cryobacterium sp.]|nr:DUF167 domain-containing protein [Cryobacterium sp.]
MLVTVRVKPSSRKGPLVERSAEGTGEELTVYVQQRAVDGQANDAVTRLLATHYGVSKSRLSIVRGHTARVKVLEVDIETSG